MGEFDVAVLIDQYAGKRISKQVYPEWRGGYYYAAKSKANPAGPLALLYVSRWSSPITAAQFAGIYAHSLNQRYKTVRGAAEIQKSDDPHSAQMTDDDSAPAPLQGRHTWTTEDGVVVIEEQADMVFITESLDDATTAALEKEVLSAPSAPK
jgi:C-terminal processing protease CtpA/Prc